MKACDQSDPVKMNPKTLAWKVRMEVVMYKHKVQNFCSSIDKSLKIKKFMWYLCLSVAKRTQCVKPRCYKNHTWSLTSIHFHLDQQIKLFFRVRQLIWVLIPNHSSVILKWREIRQDNHFATGMSGREVRNVYDPLYLSPLALQPISLVMLRQDCFHFTTCFSFSPAIFWTPSLKLFSKEQSHDKDTVRWNPF